MDRANAFNLMGHSTPLARGTRRGRIAAIGLIALSAGTGLSACDNDGGARKAAEVKVDDPFRTPPAPGDTTLRLVVGGYDGCAGDDEVKDITVDEGRREVRVGASVKVDQISGCELTTSATPFSVELEQALGERRIVDASAGGSRVIWSPEKAAQFRRVRDLTEDEVEEAFQSDHPDGSRHRCRRGGVDYFYCSYRNTNGTRTFINLVPRLEGGFESFPVQ